MILQPCPLCSRQYDVRHLEVGEWVRCQCDVEFKVKHSRDLRVQGRRCTNCGGAAENDDEVCSYCGVGFPPEEMDSLLCPSCFAHVDPGAQHCASCGLKIEANALPPIPVGKSCPRCRSKLRIRSFEDANVIECSECLGLWLDASYFQSVCRAAGRQAVPSSGPAPEGRPVRESELGYIPCLDCGELMLRRQFRRRSRKRGIVLDYCRDHGVWLDGGELEAVVAALRAGTADAPDLGLVEEVFRPRLEVEKVPEHRAAPAAQGLRLRDVLGAITGLFD